MIIDICYIWAEKWISYYDEGSSCWAGVLIATTLGLYFGCIYYSVGLYNWFGGCGMGTFSTTLNIVLMVISTLLVVLRVHPNGSILTSGGVCLFTTYMTWSALASQDDVCNSFNGDSTTTAVQISIGAALVVISLIYMSVGSSENSSGKLNVGGNVDLAGPLLEDKKSENENENELDEEKAIAPSNNANANANVEVRQIKGTKSDYQSNKYIFFHIIMTLGSIYISVLLTNYGNAQIGGNAFLEFQSNSLTVWIKLITAWCTHAVFIWTLIAPRVLAEREF